MKCTICGKEARITNGLELYRRYPKFHNIKYGRCDECNAHIQLDSDNKPIGTFANLELREARRAVLVAFDPIAVCKALVSDMRISEAKEKMLNWIANEINIKNDVCRIELFDIAQCRTVKNILTTLKKNIESKQRERTVKKKDTF